jgi:mRNA interferase RelE/StbE
MTSWNIEWSHQAIKDMDKLEKKVAQRIFKKIEQAANNPLKHFARLTGSDEYKLRIGDYRLLALLSHDSKTILVERVAHRSRVYKKK